MRGASPGPNLDQLLLPSDGDIELSEPLQKEIASRLWPSSTESDNQPQLSTAYLKYFKSECYDWRASKPVAIETYRDFLGLVDHLRTNHDKPRSSPEILDYFSRTQTTSQPGPSQPSTNPDQPLAARYPTCSADSAYNAICLTVRLWLMVNVGSLDPVVSPGKSSVEWPHDKSLDNLITSTFPSGELRNGRTSGHWSKMLNACNLDRIGGFKIYWTSNLADHLLFDDDLETVYLYHHASVLKCHHNDAGCPLPAALLDETLRTLALILPRANRRCRHWFEKEQKLLSNALDHLAADQKLGGQGRSVAAYSYWKDRLSRLAEGFDKTEPWRISSWWLDRRKRFQWCTFWTGVAALALALIFGLIQTITGILQAKRTQLGAHKNASLLVPLRDKPAGGATVRWANDKCWCPNKVNNEMGRLTKQLVRKKHGRERCTLFLRE